MGLRRSLPIYRQLPSVESPRPISRKKSLTVSAREVRLARIGNLVRDVVESVTIRPGQRGTDHWNVELVCTSVTLEQLVRLKTLVNASEREAVQESELHLHQWHLLRTRARPKEPS